MKIIKKILIFYPSYENGGATKNLQKSITFLTNRNIDIELISEMLIIQILNLKRKN